MCNWVGRPHHITPTHTCPHPLLSLDTFIWTLFRLCPSRRQIFQMNATRVYIGSESHVTGRTLASHQPLSARTNACIRSCVRVLSSERTATTNSSPREHFVTTKYLLLLYPTISRPSTAFRVRGFPNASRDVDAVPIFPKNSVRARRSSASCVSAVSSRLPYPAIVLSTPFFSPRSHTSPSVLVCAE